MEEKELGWTTIEEGKKLIEAGLDPETADMEYPQMYYEENGYYEVPSVREKNVEIGTSIPCWTLGRLLSLMPEYLKAGNQYFDLILKPGVCPACQYIDLAINSSEERTYMESRMERTLMGSVISMIKRLIMCKSTYLKEVKNGLIQKNDK